MIKQTFSIGAILIALGVIFGGAPVFADEPVVTSDEPDQAVNCIDDSGMNCEPTASGGEIAEPDDVDVATDCVEGEEGTDCMEVISVEPGAEDEADCDSDDVECAEVAEEAGEPATWPMYVSLIALGAAIVVFIVLNIFSGKKK